MGKPVMVFDLVLCAFPDTFSKDQDIGLQSFQVIGCFFVVRPKLDKVPRHIQYPFAFGLWLFRAEAIRLAIVCEIARQMNSAPRMTTPELRTATKGGFV